jgi:DNA-binding response OmpR family regulator
VSPTPEVRVLVVEDFEQLRDTLVRGLELAGFAARGADSVREALDLPPAGYDVLLTDQRLGDGLGTDLFRVLHERDPGIGSRFILMTGDERDMGLPAEVPVLLKPFRIEALVAAVRLLPGRPATGPVDAGADGTATRTATSG